MALLLVHRRMDGKPLGIFDDAGDSFYLPDVPEADIAQGKASIEDKAPNLPWSVFVDRRTSGFNHRYLWDAIESSRSLQETLHDLRIQHNTDENKDIPADR